jgi:aminomethyltransferase
MSNVSDNYTLLAVQGPKAAEALKYLTEVDIVNQKYYTFAVSQFAGINNVIISATGYTGSGGFEIYVKNEDAAALWDEVFKAGADVGILPIGLAARDTLRLEMGFCLYGNDINDTTSPLEAGLGWITKLKTDDFVGKDKILAVKEAGLKRRLIGFEMIDRGIPRHDYLIVDKNDNEIGIVTSGTQSPSLNKAIGLGYVNVDFKEPDAEIYIQVRNKKIKAKVVKFPFYKN